MRNRFISKTNAIGFGLILALAAFPAAAQTTTTAKTNAKAAAKPGFPRMPDGHPDFQGTYDLETMTPFERLPGDPPVLTKEQADKLQNAEKARRAKDTKITDAEHPLLPVGGDKSAPGKSFFEILERAGGGAVGGYGREWLSQGNGFMVIDGQIRTSIVVDPPNGHIPPYNAKAKARMGRMGARVLPTSDAGESNDVRAATRRGEFDDPETRPLSERCILGFGSTAGPPALPDYFYNDNHQIVQTKDTVMILSEMIHDARIVRMNAEHLPKTFRQWMGDSVGHWEGDTLVIDTTNFNDKTRFHGATENLHIIERISRQDANTLLYHFTVEDPDTWDTAWSGEETWPTTNKLIYEYACQEGNYALGDVMRGARKQEADEAAAAGKTGGSSHK